MSRIARFKFLLFQIIQTNCIVIKVRRNENTCKLVSKAISEIQRTGIRMNFVVLNVCETERKCILYYIFLDKLNG